MPLPKIYNIKEPLDLDRLRLAKPTNKNGSHFIKTLDIDNPIYFLGPKCFTKQGFVKSGKKIFCDFVFSNEDSEFLAWLENLEESARKSIYANRETWFETPLDEHDIESSMSPAYKSYKSGKYFIVRANVPTALDKINIKVYDEKEEETDPENIKENTRVLAVFEFQGIRCSIRSFQFEIELKQLLIVEPEKLFETCIIGKNTPNTTSSTSLRSEKENETLPSQEPEPAMTDTKRIGQPSHLSFNSLSDEKSENESRNDPVLDEISNDKDAEFATDTSLSIDKPNVEVPIPVEIFDADFPLEDITDSNTEKEPPLRLKKRNDVYYKLYKEMRQRAREAKREAFANYLEAKRIKNTYLLEDVSDSESDEDDT
jgi:hypothetical protein